MFGYIQPLKCELKVREYDYYRTSYCGLCNSLRKCCGIKARFIVNYDFVFAALLLTDVYGCEEKVEKKRCIACPGGRQCIHSEVYDKIANVSVILTYLKLSDDVEDTGFLKGLFCARIPKLLLSGAYRRAKKSMPEYDRIAAELYVKLCDLEEKRTPSLDEPADVFARMLASIPDGDSTNERILREIFYHVGRYIYIIDALDDYENDVAKNEYNPIAERFGIHSKELTDEVREAVHITLEDSRHAIMKAFALIENDKNDAHPILRNIIELGMSGAIGRVIKKENKK